MARSQSPTILSITSNATTSQQFLPGNNDRKLAMIFNNSTANLYLAYAPLSSPASSTYFSVLIPPNGYYVIEAGYTGPLQGLWAAANGTAQVTEVS